MSLRIFTYSFAVLALVAMTVPVRAKSSSNDQLKATINVYENSKVVNTSLNPGEYTVIVDGNQAKFERDGKVVAEVPCSLKTLGSKAPANAIVTDKNQVTEIQFGGKNQAIDFATS